jgi:hypothetical protein
LEKASIKIGGKSPTEKLTIVRSAQSFMLLQETRKQLAKTLAF